jgi:hypothetical protein
MRLVQANRRAPRVVSENVIAMVTERWAAYAGESREGQ